MEMTVHSDLRMNNKATRTWTRFQMTSYQLMLRKMNLNKTEIAGDDGTVAVPLAERTQLHELSVLQRYMDHVIYDEILTKQLSMLFAAH